MEETKQKSAKSIRFADIPLEEESFKIKGKSLEDIKSLYRPAPPSTPPIPSSPSLQPVQHLDETLQNGERRKLCYFGHEDDGRCTLFIRGMKLPAFIYNDERPAKLRHRHREEQSKPYIFKHLKACDDCNLDRFLVAPDRKNVWMGGIRSQCEGVLTAKTYISKQQDNGAYTVVPEIEGAKVTAEGVYKMWLALELAMMRRESLVIVEDPALAQVTKWRTEQWRRMNRFVTWGSFMSIFFATFARRYSSLYVFPFCIAIYGFGMLRAMNQRDPASKYSECSINKQYENDPDSHMVSDAQVSLRYLRAPHYRMFKLEDHKSRTNFNITCIGIAGLYGLIALFRNVYDFDYHHMITRTFEANPGPPQPLNIFEQITKRFITFGNSPHPGRVDLVHWIIQNGLFYHFILRHFPWMIQTLLEYLEREHVMESSIRYLQFRNLQGEEQYELPARNLYKTMQKDYPNNRVLKEMFDHYETPPEGYYESEEFLKVQKPQELTLSEALHRWKISYYRNW